MGNTKCGTVQYVTGEDQYTILCDEDGVEGDTVTIFGTENQYLTLCELEIMVNESTLGNYKH